MFLTNVNITLSDQISEADIEKANLMFTEGLNIR